MRELILLFVLVCLPTQALAFESTNTVTAATATTAATAAPAEFQAASTVETAATGSAVSLSDAEVSARLVDIQTSLENRRKHADYWYYGWISFYAATVVGQGVIGYTSDSEKIRAGQYVGAGTSTLAVIGMLISPIPTGSVADDVNALPRGTPEEREASLAEAERIFATTQQAEVNARRWTEHALGFLVSGSAAAFMYFRYDDWENALMKIGSGLLFGQTRPLTGPIANHDFWPSYQPATPPLPTSVTGFESLRLYPTPKGVMATVQF
jgi:hypothetical protein